jgi:sugar lactone lactonase YvrE
MWDFKVHKLSAEGEKEEVCTVPNRPSGLGFLKDGTPLVVSMTDRRIYRVKDGLEPYADLAHLVAADLNDLMMDPQGRAYVGNFGYDLFGGAAAALADLLLVQPDGSARVVASGLNFPNGSVLIDGGRTLVIAETWGNCLTAFDRASDGRLSNRRIYVNLGDRTPDGICVDREDGIWVSSFVTGEFVRYSAGGELTDRIECSGKRAVSCVLGGLDNRTLYCSTFEGAIEDIHNRKRAGAIETVRVEVPGLI